MHQLLKARLLKKN